MDKEIRTDTGLVPILDRPTEGETVSVLIRRVGVATQEDRVQVRDSFLGRLVNSSVQSVPTLESRKYENISKQLHSELVIQIQCIFFFCISILCRRNS